MEKQKAIDYWRDFRSGCAKVLQERGVSPAFRERTGLHSLLRSLSTCKIYSGEVRPYCIIRGCLEQVPFPRELESGALRQGQCMAPPTSESSRS